MDVEYIKVNTQKLGDDSVSVKKYLDDLAELKVELETGITQLNQMWTGEAYTAFRQAVDDDLKALQTVIDNVTEVYNFEVKAKSEYESCEQTVATLINSVTIGS